MRYISNEDFICTYHNIIKKNLKQIAKIINADNSSIEEIKELLEEMNTCINYAHKAGIKMEKRLAQYKSCVESLGFERVKNTK